jgi:hypothetical protein
MHLSPVGCRTLTFGLVPKGRLRVAQDVVLGDVDRARMLTGDHQKPAQFSSILARVHSIDPVVSTSSKSDETERAIYPCSFASRIMSEDAPGSWGVL